MYFSLYFILKYLFVYNELTVIWGIHDIKIIIPFYLFCSDDQQYIYKDAIVLSPHKFLGGPGCPGVLIAKKKLFVNPVPAQCGGGTVFFVRREHHTYLKEVSHLQQC